MKHLDVREEFRDVINKTQLLYEEAETLHDHLALFDHLVPLQPINKDEEGLLFFLEESIQNSLSYHWNYVL